MSAVSPQGSRRARAKRNSSISSPRPFASISSHNAVARMRVYRDIRSICRVRRPLEPATAGRSPAVATAAAYMSSAVVIPRLNTWASIRSRSWDQLSRSEDFPPPSTSSPACDAVFRSMDCFSHPQGSTPAPGLSPTPMPVDSGLNLRICRCMRQIFHKQAIARKVQPVQPKRSPTRLPVPPIGAQSPPGPRNGHPS